MKFLIVGPSWVGDMVMAQSLFITLKKLHPNCTIDVLAPGWSLPIIERMPEVRRGIEMPLGHGQLNLGVRKVLGRSLISEQYTHAITLPATFKSALVPYWAKIPKRIGWRGEMRFGILNDRRVLDKQRYPLMVSRYQALAYVEHAELPPADEPRLQVNVENRDAALQKYNLTTDRPILALCPGAEFGPSKQWPAEHYADVAQTMVERGYQVWLFGSPKDNAIADTIRSLLPEAQREHCRNLAGETTLADAVDIMSLATAVVSNDSGLMHVAAALDVNLVAVFGSTTEKHTPPLSSKAAVVNLHLECSPCHKKICPLGTTACMKTLIPELVLTQLDRLLSAA